MCIANLCMFCTSCTASQQARRTPLTFEQEEQLEKRDQTLGSLLDQLGGTIQGKAVHITPSKVCFPGVCRTAHACDDAYDPSFKSVRPCAVVVNPLPMLLSCAGNRSRRECKPSPWLQTAVAACLLMPSRSCCTCRRKQRGDRCRHSTC